MKEKCNVGNNIPNVSCQEAVMLEVHHESGGFAPWNFGSACLGGRNDRISVECLNLVHRGGVITLGGTIFHWGIMKEML